MGNISVVKRGLWSTCLRGFRRLMTVMLAALLLVVLFLDAAPALAQTVIISQASGPPGTSLTVTGSGFDNGETYTITFAPATLYEQLLAPTTTISGTTFSRAVTIPPAPWGAYSIAVVASSSGTFSPSFQVTPQIQLTAASGFTGDTISVTGQGFRASSSVNLVFNNSTIVSTSSNTYGSLNPVDFAVPSLPRGTYNIYGTDGAYTSPSIVFNIQPRLTISPQEGAVGSQVQLTGTGYGASATITITWDSQVISSSIFSSTTGSFSSTLIVPASIRGTHQIAARDTGLAQSTASFLVRSSITVAPATGSPGTVVTVAGQGFRSNSSVSIKFNGATVATQPVSVISNSSGSFSATFISPSIVSGNYVVNASDGVYSATATFGVAANVAISPISGSVGSELIVSGTGFTPGGRVALSYDNQSVITVTADSAGAFSVSFNVPVSMAGQHAVTARDVTAQGVIASATFTMEATPPPAPTLLSPPYDSQTDVRPSFVWSAVTDPSGVSYDLQVARDAAFSQLLLFKQGLAEPQYRVEQSEQLPLTKRSNPYYWRIRATDGAGNASAWTSAGSFYTQDSAAPAPPVHFSPANDSEATVQPNFTWSTVSDPSGVSYNLQVARDTGFTQIVLFKQGLTQPEYQVSPQEQFQLTKRTAPYYWRVQATDGAANASDWTAPGSFYTEDSTPPPAPAPLTPENGARTRANVSFDWTDVSDPSGILYTLEAAQDSEFTHLVVFKEGLETSEYQLKTMEELTTSTGTPAAPYYWRVRAVDGAQNLSEWSVINTFYVGGFELRGGLLYAVIIIGGALVLAGGIFIGMRLRRAGPPEEKAEKPEKAKEED